MILIRLLRYEYTYSYEKCLLNFSVPRKKVIGVFERGSLWAPCPTKTQIKKNNNNVMILRKKHFFTPHINLDHSTDFRPVKWVFSKHVDNKKITLLCTYLSATGRKAPIKQNTLSLNCSNGLEKSTKIYGMNDI